MSDHTPAELPVPSRPAPPVAGDPGGAGGPPFGIGEGARGVGAVLGGLWALRADPAYAARVLTWSVGDGCGLGSRGLEHPVLPGRHLCPNRIARIRRELERRELVPADVLDLGVLRGRTAASLRAMGRLPFPLLHRAGERGFSRLSWAEALELAGQHLAATPGPQQAWLAGPQDLSNEGAWALATAAARLGAPPPRLAAGGTWAAAAEGLAGAGRGASFSALIGADLILLLGLDPVRTQPAMVRLLHRAKAAGARVVAINPAREPGLERAWSLDAPGLAVWGTRIADDFLQVRPGGDAALLSAVLLNLARWGEVTAPSGRGWEALVEALEARGLEAWIDDAGVGAQEVEWLARLVSRAGTLVSVFSGGFADPAWGVDAVRALANLHLARGAIGRPGSAILPLAERLSIAGAADCGLVPCGALDGGAALIWLAGLDPLAELPGAAATRAALSGAAVRIHQAPWLDPSMLVEPGELTLILPSCLRHEQPGGTTSTSSDGVLRYSPEIPGHPQIAEARPDWRIPLLAVHAADPSLPEAPQSAAALRREMAALPGYGRLPEVHKAEGWLRLSRGEPSEPLRFVPIALRPPRVRAEGLLLSARRPPEGEPGELPALLLSASDAERARVREGDRVIVRSAHGRAEARVQIADLREGSAQLERPAAAEVMADPGCVEVQIERA